MPGGAEEISAHLAETTGLGFSSVLGACSGWQTDPWPIESHNIVLNRPSLNNGDAVLWIEGKVVIDSTALDSTLRRRFPCAGYSLQLLLRPPSNRVPSAQTRFEFADFSAGPIKPMPGGQHRGALGSRISPRRGHPEL
ncbi:MAG: hypothetical protein WB867_04555 [Candidatus Dormiibacterota bacterium]